MRIISFDCGITNLAWCVYDNDTDRIIDWQVKNIKLPERQHLKEHLIRSLDQLGFGDVPALCDGNDAVHVVIERQPSKNSICKGIESTLENYFLIRGIIDRPPDSNIKRVCVFNAKHKLAGQKIVRGKKAYRERKQRSIELASQLDCVKHSSWSGYLQSLLKQDDACDALLQAKAYCDLNDKERSSMTDKPIIARKPKDMHDLSPAGCKYLLKQMLYPRLRKQRAGALERLPNGVADNRELTEAVNRHFGDLNNALMKLRLIP